MAACSLAKAMVAIPRSTPAEARIKLKKTRGLKRADSEVFFFMNDVY